jgi:dATP pyrophosphohydrolase
VRQPLTVLVLPFARRPDGPRYAVFRRSDDGFGQPVSGGVEDGEDDLTAARRELAEETGLTGLPLYRLDMTSGVEKTCFAAHLHWPADLYVVPKHYFATDAAMPAVTGTSQLDVVLSDEHSGMAWLPYAEAHPALRYDDDRTALWELDARLRTGDLPVPQ